MALFNYATREITIKIVYYGPGLSGKTTNLQFLHSVLNPDTRGKLLSLATEADRTLFFDFLPVELGKISDFSIRFQLYTVPGQVRYNATRKLVLKGADAVVFVADSQREIREQNIDSLVNMRENLTANNIDPDDIPVILQYNKRDLPNILSIDELNRDLNEDSRYPFTESVAIDGTGVHVTFQQITRLVMNRIAKKHKIHVETPADFMESPEEAGAQEELRPAVKNEPPVQTPIVDPSRYQEYEKEQMLSTPPPPSEKGIVKPPSKEVPAKEAAVKKAKEVPVIPKEQLNQFIKGINELTQTLKDLQNVITGIHTEVKDLKIITRKDQKEMIDMLKEMNDHFSNLKEKKSWFRFS